MRYVFAAALILVILTVTVGALTGRVKASGCCAVADPRRDLRMRGAFEDDMRAADRHDLDSPRP
jgi:hypothetical protein